MIKMDSSALKRGLKSAQRGVSETESFLISLAATIGITVDQLIDDLNSVSYKRKPNRADDPPIEKP